MRHVLEAIVTAEQRWPSASAQKSYESMALMLRTSASGRCERNAEH